MPTASSSAPRAGIPVACEADESVGDLSRGAALALFRIVQEALGNAAKHAAAKRIIVRLTRSDGVVSLTVSDDGVGLDRSRLGQRRRFGVGDDAGTRQSTERHVRVRERAGTRHDDQSGRSLFDEVDAGVLKRFEPGNGRHRTGIRADGVRAPSR